VGRGSSADRINGGHLDTFKTQREKIEPSAGLGEGEDVRLIAGGELIVKGVRIENGDRVRRKVVDTYRSTRTIERGEGVGGGFQKSSIGEKRKLDFRRGGHKGRGCSQRTR